MSLHVHGKTIFTSVTSDNPPIATPHDALKEAVLKRMKQEQNKIGRLERKGLISTTPVMNKNIYPTPSHRHETTTKKIRRERKETNREISKSKIQKGYKFKKTRKGIKRARKKKSRIGTSQKDNLKKILRAKDVKKSRKKRIDTHVTLPGNADYFEKKRNTKSGQLRERTTLSNFRRQRLYNQAEADEKDRLEGEKEDAAISERNTNDPKQAMIEWEKKHSTPKYFPRRETVEFMGQCNVTRDYCTLAYYTGAICARTLYNHYNTFDNYCVMDYVNCMERFDVWQIMHIGPCLKVDPFSEYVHYPYQDDYFLDRDFLIEDM